jgi:acyl-CoA thioesterase I
MMARWMRLLVWVVMVPLVLGCQRSPSYPSLPAGSAVLALGDSVTFGTGAGAGEDYPTRLAGITDWQVHNRGIPGDTAEAARGRIDAALDEVRPALVIVEVGGNDFLRRRGDAAIKADIRHILQRVRARNLPAVLVAVPRFSLAGAVVGSLPDAKLYEELAKEEGVLLVPDVFGRILADPDQKADPIHPNAAGYRRLAEGIAAVLARSGLLAQR